jgi:hypothetical protein
MNLKDKYNIGSEFLHQKEIIVGQLVNQGWSIYRYMGKQDGKFVYIEFDGLSEIGQKFTTVYFADVHSATPKKLSEQKLK